MPELNISDAIIARLAVHLGPNVSRMAVKSFARKVGVAAPENLTAAHVPALVEELHPMLNVMIGRAPADAVVAEIARAVAH